jgi:murein DD-endopeptidase MepM/ murein hydrolase activator NlpD
MERWLKPGIDLFPKIKFRAKQAGVFAVLIAWLAATISCSQGYVTAYDITATALFSGGGAGGGGTLPETFIPTEGGLPVTPQPDVTTTPAVAETALTPLTPTATATPENQTPLPPVLYYSQAGDTLPALAARFGVGQDEITSNEIFEVTGFIPAGKLLIIPNRLGETGPVDQILPDSEIVFSPSALDFDIEAFVNETGGYLAGYREYMSNGWTSGARVIEKVAIENSINPRLLLALVEFQAGWVYGEPKNLALTDYPLGYIKQDKKGLYKQLSWAVQQLSLGYYGWREGILTSVPFNDGSQLRLAPGINAGTAAVEYLFARLYHPDVWNGVIFGTESFGVLYERMYGNAWLRAQTVEPLLPVNLSQPELQLPFLTGRSWSFTGGPHSAWGPDGARAALDFAPPSVQSGCVDSDEWVAAMASGLVVRSGNGVVMVDLDGDGFEQTGWSILYLHVASEDRISQGAWVEQGSRIGHPSCEGGSSTGTHVHVARKYNGEWVLAGGALPFTMDGWIAQAGEKPYQGTLVRGDEIVEAKTFGSFETRISRPTGGN